MVFQQKTLSSNTIEMMIMVINPVYGRNDEFLGAMGIYQSLGTLSTLMANIEPTPGGFAMVVHPFGRLITAPTSAFYLLFGDDFQFNATDDDQTNLRNVVSGNFSQVLFEKYECLHFAVSYRNEHKWLYLRHIKR